MERSSPRHMLLPHAFAQRPCELIVAQIQLSQARQEKHVLRHGTREVVVPHVELVKVGQQSDPPRHLSLDPAGHGGFVLGRDRGTGFQSVQHGCYGCNDKAGMCWGDRRAQRFKSVEYG